MGTLMPEGDALKKAVRWISEYLKTKEYESIDNIINEAVFRFDLNPKESLFLYNLYQKSKNKDEQ